MVLMIASLVIVVIAVMIIISQQQSIKNTKQRLLQAQQTTSKLEQKIETARSDIKKSKEDLERERNALRDARELVKKKFRRQGTIQADQEFTKGEMTMTDRALEDSQKALLAMEAQIEQLKKEREQDEEAIRARLREEWNNKDLEKNTQIEELKKKIAHHQEELKKQKRLMRPEGIKIDLKALPDEAASEFARVFRKADQHERLHGIARAKLHLAQEKFTDLQKRYFSVCRELAVLTGNKEDVEPKAARDIAEKLVAEHKGDGALAAATPSNNSADETNEVKQS